MSQLKTYQVDIKGRKLQASDYPGGKKGTIIGIHGLTGNRMQLRYYAEKFSQGYRFITMDLRGRGNSTPAEEESSIFHHVEDVIALIKELNIENPILMGYSMGGFIAAIVATKLTDVKKVILLDGAATMSEHQRPIVEPSLGRLSKHFGSQEEYVQQVTESYKTLGVTPSLKLNEVLQYEIEDKGTYWENKASEISVRQDWESFWDFNLTELGPLINVPVLLIQCAGGIGNHPPLFLPEHYEDTVENINDLQVVVSESNHYTMVFENQEDINAVIESFL